jgi:hypothetical protein
VVLGAAYQRGFVPVSLEAMEAAMRRLEQRGKGVEAGQRRAPDGAATVRACQPAWRAALEASVRRGSHLPKT